MSTALVYPAATIQGIHMPERFPDAHATTIFLSFSGTAAARPARNSAWSGVGPGSEKAGMFTALL
jgi:hypothetical protein